MDAGETFEEAARRELWEETGITGVELGPCVLADETSLTIGGEEVRFVQRFFLVRVAERAVSLDGHSELERHVYRDHRWWTVAELEATQEAIFPERLAEIVRSLV